MDYSMNCAPPEIPKSVTMFSISLSHTMTLSAKLAGALGGIARSGLGAEPGLTIASLKRALDVLHQAITAAGALGVDAPFPAARLAHYRVELFAIR
jgi:hypothetical protein